MMKRILLAAILLALLYTPALAQQVPNPINAPVSVTNGDGFCGTSKRQQAADCPRTVGVPQGRLTLVTATPVLTTDETAKAQIFYDCSAGGNSVPYYDGAIDNLEAISGCEVSLTMVAGASTVGGDNSTTGGINAAGVFDVWWVHGGASRVCIANGAASGHSGGGWSSDTGGSITARGSGYSAIHNTRGYYTNTNAITHCWNGSTDYNSVSADQGTYLGSLFTTAAGQTGVSGLGSCLTGSSAPPASIPTIGIFNPYNTTTMSVCAQDSSANAAYNTNTWRALDNSANNAVAWIDGLTQRTAFINTHIVTASASNAGCSYGATLDSTSAPPLSGYFNAIQFNSTTILFGAIGLPGLNFPPQTGFHFVTAMHKGSGTGICTWSYANQLFALQILD